MMNQSHTMRRAHPFVRIDEPDHDGDDDANANANATEESDPPSVGIPPKGAPEPDELHGE